VKENVSAFQLIQAAESVVITLACTGDIQAFEEIVRRCQNRVRSFMHRLCSRPDLAEDLAQQVFLKAWRSIGQLRAPGAFHGWLNRIMVSIWLEEARRRKLDVAEWDDSAPLEAPRDAPSERIDLDEALAQLPPPMRLCVVMAYNEGLSHQEISDATHIPLGSVKTNISRGAAKMRVLLCDYRKSNRG
jgi:RNA polymerase sigma-70 factor (ECF subfamily)